MNKCECGNSLFPGQFRCEKCGKIVPKQEEPKKQEKRTIKKGKEE